MSKINSEFIKECRILIMILAVIMHVFKSYYNTLHTFLHYKILQKKLKENISKFWLNSIQLLNRLWRILNSFSESINDFFSILINCLFSLINLRKLTIKI